MQPMLEYGSSIWSPVYQSDIYKLESIQKHYTKRFHGFSNSNYIERLKRLGIDTLEKRRLYCDLTLSYKMIYSHATLVFTDYFIINKIREKNNNYQVKVQPSKINVRSHFFTNRVTRAWNSLSEVIITAPSLSSFKSRLQDFDFNKFLIVK